MDFSLGKIVPTFLLFGCKAVAEILGCYFLYLILKQGKSVGYMDVCDLEFGDICLAINTTSRRFWADLCCLSGIYIFTALLWLHFFDQVALTRWDLLGRLVALVGASLMILQPHGLIR